MIRISLPDGSIKEFEKPITAFDVTKDISRSLSKKALVSKINGELKDLSFLIKEDSSIEIITPNETSSLDILRHDCAHVLGQAVQELFPNTQIAFGPSIKDGFYYDFYGEKKFSPSDFPKIEKKMHQIIKQNNKFERKLISQKEAYNYFLKKGEKLKAEHALSLPKDSEISLYSQGNWSDLCKGPHSPSTSKIGKAFKLTKVSGAYWKNDSKNAQLQRVYGTVWHNNADLENYLTKIEEAKQRDHRKLGTELDLFHVQEAAVGSVFWHPKGWKIYIIIEDYIRKKLDKYDYQEIRTPQILDRSLWEKSGHWDKFREAMFTLEDGEKTLAIKPMNCPGHVEIFKRSQVSYKQLPIRLSEFGCCHRNEPSGSLQGIMRVRAFTQDDAHIFCTEDQIIDETNKFCTLLKNIYNDFGFSKIKVKFSDRPELRAGTDEDWDKAEKSLKEATSKAGLEWDLNKGEGAFYGPKLEFTLIDCLEREWQCGTLQVDYILPKRLGATYITKEGTKENPIMLHRAILGSFERFIGILIEHHKGSFPIWLAPIQIAVLPITDSSLDYAKKIFAICKDLNYRIILDDRAEKLQYKIREHSLQKIPMQFILGEKEKTNGTITIRYFGTNEQKTISLKECLSLLKNVCSLPL